MSRTVPRTRGFHFVIFPVRRSKAAAPRRLNVPFGAETLVNDPPTKTLFRLWAIVWTRPLKSGNFRSGLAETTACADIIGNANEMSPASRIDVSARLSMWVPFRDSERRWVARSEPTV
jgi:hypothetical protein